MKYFTAHTERDILDMLSVNSSDGFTNRSACFETYYHGGTPSSATPHNNVAHSFEGYLCVRNGEMSDRAFILDGERLKIRTHHNYMTREPVLSINGIRVGSGTADRFYTAVARLSQPIEKPVCIGMKKYVRGSRPEDDGLSKVFDHLDDIIFNRMDAVTMVTNRDRQYVFTSATSSLVDEYENAVKGIKSRAYIERVSCPLINSYVTTHLLPDLDRRGNLA